ncbi:hypothetical protein [Actinoplanes sp. NPDC048796]|uniref:hypothetical protein n=1 Tax=Actinoplanes sp. NPDC048796 TaxID=3155640 RepID=UPI0033F7D083
MAPWGTVLLVVLLPHLALKCVAIINATRWVSRRGDDYRRLYAENPPRSDAEKIALLKATGARFFPFGAKEYRVRERYISLIGRTGAAAVLGWALRLWSTFYTAPGVVAAAVVIIAVPELLARTETGPRGLALACALLATAVALLAYLEALAWYLTVGSYARVYLTLGFHRSLPGSAGENLAELRLYIYLAIATLVSNSLACLVAAVSFDAFHYADGAPVGHGPGAVTGSLLHTASNMSFLGDSPFQANNALGYLLGAMDVSQGVVLLLFGLAMLPSFLGRRPPA